VGRRGAFEVTLALPGGAAPRELWSGLKKGPPRKLKFLEKDKLIALVRAAIEAK
jgi:hypothetical protein